MMNQEEDSEISSYWGASEPDVKIDDIREVPESKNLSPQENKKSEIELPLPSIAILDCDKVDVDLDLELEKQIPKNDLNESENETKMDMTTTGNDDDPAVIITQSDHAKAVAKTITPIHSNVVHQICSGQVIVTLATAVKELVENAIDAGATSVEIRLVDHGSQLIEVVDNGSGVEESNFEGLAQKHCTSKIRAFEDLIQVETFGFRGEALSSLCALTSSLTVTTRSKNSSTKTGFKIEYDSHGRIVSKVPAARDFGTTVTLGNIFCTLPVRHREFKKNLKREFHKMINVLYGYCLISGGVRISCTHQINGTNSNIFNVAAALSMKERIVAIFGTKQLQSLMEFSQEDVIDEECLAEFGLNVKTFVNDKYQIEGFVSKPHHGRSSNDRQFFFVNSRPCDPSKISKITNEAFHSYGKSQQCPFVCMNIKTSLENVDVNVTPDKRVLYLQSEKSLFVILKASLISMYTSQSSTFDTSSSVLNMNYFSQSQQSQQSQKSSQSQSQERSRKSYSFPTTNNKFYSGDVNSFASQFSSPSSSVGSSTLKSSGSKGKTVGSLLERFAKDKTPSFSGGFNKSNFGSAESPNKRQKREPKGDLKERFGLLSSSKFNIDREIKSTGNNTQEEEMEIATGSDDGIEEDSSSTLEEIRSFLFHSSSQEELNDSEEDSAGSATEEIKIIYDDELEEGKIKHVNPVKASIRIDFEELKEKLKQEKAQEIKEKSYASKFRAKITPGENGNAEDELKRQLSKEMFSQMEIIGQFNLGFVVVKFGPDLFIVDQHASDEKYNFEELQKTTVMQTQRLISPMELQLPAVSENIIIENLEMFRKNGFDFLIDFNEQPTKRVSLIKIPFSKSSQFGKSDVEELIFMMEDAPEKDQTFIRPSKVREMMASRACRKSVMIGTSLNFNDMRKIIDHMGEMEQPWNCPHGRPTIRHLMNTNLLPDFKMDAFNHSSAEYSSSQSDI